MGISLGGKSSNDQRQTTSNLGKIVKKKGFSIKDLAKSTYYSILIG